MVWRPDGGGWATEAVVRAVPGLSRSGLCLGSTGPMFIFALKALSYSIVSDQGRGKRPADNSSADFP
jgi:hypothetical protein